MGLYSWTANSELTKPELRQAVYDAVSHGIHWMVTPYREIVLVHAVLQPLNFPRFGNTNLDPESISFGVAPRRLGESRALLTGEINVDNDGTSKPVIEASWNEQLDTPETDAVPRSSHVLEIKINQNRKYKADADEKGKIWIPIEGGPGKPSFHFFEDTKYRKVKYKVTSTSRFGEYFTYDPNNPNDPNRVKTRTTPDVQAVTLDILNSKKPNPPKVKVHYSDNSMARDKAAKSK